MSLKPIYTLLGVKKYMWKTERERILKTSEKQALNWIQHELFNKLLQRNTLLSDLIPLTDPTCPYIVNLTCVQIWFCIHQV